ncbi:MAG: SulP family inorganic anion transporter [Gammaproteobacteria bacterium]|nr:SulP family inorganic anion transporter [Gammaproteobacteria bacterium]
MNNLKTDLPASLVVVFVAIPLCLGIALASGAPLFSGLIAGIIGGIVVGTLSGSSQGVSGPAAGLAVIVLTAIQSIDNFQVFLVAVVIAGAIQIGLGLLKAGIIAYFFPSSVIKGMLSGIGIIIFLKQIPHAFGYDKDYEGDLDFYQPDGQTTFSELSQMIDFISPGAVLLSLFSLTILILWENKLAKLHSIFRVVQGPLVVVILGAVFQVVALKYFPHLAARADQLVSIPVAESLTEFLTFFSFPDFSAITRSDIWILGLTLAIVASLETLLCVEATDKLDPHKRVTPTNRELIAQGTGNIISGFIGGLPITQVIVRSSANIQSGAQTKLSAIFHGILLLFFTLFIPQLLNLVPLSVLACILLVVGYKLAKPALFVSMYKLGALQFVPFIATILGIMFTDLLKGIVIGLLIGICVILRDNFRNSHFLHIEKSEGAHAVKLTLAEEVSFLNKGAISRVLNSFKQGTDLTIDLSKCYSIDYDVIEIIENYRKSSADRKVKVTIIEEEKLALTT